MTLIFLPMEKPKMTQTIQITCEHLVVVPGPHGTMHHIAFNPSEETVKKVTEWHKSEEEAFVQIADRAGDHTRRLPVRAMNMVFDYGTLVFTVNR